MTTKTGILVTGGTGLVGAHLLFHLTSKGHQVRALKRKKSSLELAKKVFAWYGSINPKQWDLVTWFDGDLLDINSLEDAFDGIGYVYHAAAIVSFQGTDKSIIAQTNHTGTANLVNIALNRKITKLVYVSSIGTLGRSEQDEEVSETHFWNNKKTSVYSKSKYDAEQEVWRGMAEGLSAVIINPSIIIGPGNWSQGSAQLFSTLWKGLKFYTAGSNGFVCVNDVVRIMILLMNSEINGERFIVSSENVSYEQLFLWMAEGMEVANPKIKAGPILSAISWRLLALKGLFTGKKSTITRETAQTAQQNYKYTNKKIKTALRFEFTPVKQCVIQTAKFFLQDKTRN